MDLIRIRLFSSIILVILVLVDFSSQDFDNWFKDTNNENLISRDSSDNKSNILSSVSSEEPIISSTSTTSSSETSSTPSSTTPSTTPSTIPSTTPSTTQTTIPTTSSTASTTPSTQSTSPSTSPSSTSSSTPFTSPTTTLTTRVRPDTSVQPISTNSLMVSTDPTPETTSAKAIECLKIELNAKIIFKYVSNEGFDQQFEIIAGNTNGELIQPDKCLRNQTLVIKYDLVEKTQLTLGISIDDTEVSIKSIRFEYPFNRLPDDFNKENHSEEVQTCSADKTARLYDNCLIAYNNYLSELSLKYKVNDQIFCKELPPIVLKNNKTSVDIVLKDFRFVITNSQSDQVLTQTSHEYCPINSENELDAMFAGSTKMWIGVSYAIVGALIMFGFVFIYEKFVRERLLYKPIDREEPEI